MNTISEHPANLDLVLESSDPKFVHLLLDTAHSLAGGGDPAEAVAKYHDRILLMHLKDTVDISTDTRATISIPIRGVRPRPRRLTRGLHRAGES